MKRVVCALGLAATAFIAFYWANELSVPKTALPRLQATGCDGAREGATLYAMEEDDLPFCNAIEEYRP